MFRVGDITWGKNIGKADRNGKFIWQACIDCGKERWIQFAKKKPLSLRCNSCANRITSTGRIDDKCPNWKGGRIYSGGGYVWVIIRPNDFFYPMANKKGYVFEHRLVVAKHFNRCLLSWEVVHHKNHIRDDNRLENLQLLPSGRQHLPSIRWRPELRKRDKRIEELEKRVTLLEAENTLLRELEKMEQK